MESISEFLVFFLKVIFWITVIEVSAGMVAHRLQAKKAKHQAILDAVIESVHMVNIEEVNGMRYWWDKLNGEFLAQGTSNDEIISVIKQRFPTDVFLIATETECFKLEAPDWTLTQIELQIEAK